VLVALARLDVFWHTLITMSIINVPRKKRGRPATGTNPRVPVRMPQELIDKLEAWCKKNDINRSEAIRQFIENGLQDE